MVNISITPLAKPSRLEPTSSLMIPSLEGLRMADCSERKNRQITAMVRIFDAMQTVTTSRTESCIQAANRITRVLEKLSLIHPATGANKTKGASIISPSTCAKLAPHAAPPAIQTPSGRRV